MRLSERTLLTCQNPKIYEEHRKQALEKFERFGIKARVTRHLFQERQTGLLNRGPLFGLTFCIKDCILVRGAPCSCGIAPPFVTDSQYTAPLIERLESYGASLIASTTLDPCCLNFTGKNRFLGDLPNYLFPDRICGGSSSGVAYAVAARFCELGIGTDSGGSVRIPAVANGVCGYRPNSSLFPRGGMLLLSESMDGPGFVTHSPLDLHDLLLSLGVSSSKVVPLTELLIPHSEDLKVLDPEFRLEFEQSLSRIEERTDLVIREIQPVFASALETRKILFAFEAAEQLQSHLESKLDTLPEAIALCRFADTISQEQLAQAALRRAEISTILNDLNEQSLLLSPALATPLPLASSERYIQPLHYYFCLANLLDLPAVAFNRRAGDPASGLQVAFHKDCDHQVAGRIGSLHRILLES